MVQPSRDEKHFNSILLDILNDVLIQVFGETPAKVILHYMKIRYGLERGRIPDNLETFSAVLEEILGQNAGLIEGLILRRLSSALELEEPIPNLLDIEKVRKRLLESES
ncbi:MAG: hypothetical protein ACE5NN_04115 [Candidatus Bathyarchaeia archaeon]